MKIPSTLLSSALAAIAVAAMSSVYAQGPMPAQGTPDIMIQLAQALKAANLNTLSQLAGTHAQALVPMLMLPGNKTLLAPSDAAIEKARSTLSGMPVKLVEQILMFHIVNGTISYSSLPNMFDFHLIARTFLNDSVLVQLPNGQKQALVLHRPETDKPLEISFGANDTRLTSTKDGPTIGPLQVHIIDDLLFPPRDVGKVLQEEGDDMATTYGSLKNLSLIDPLVKVNGLTLFAPTSEAFRNIRTSMAQAPFDAVKAALMNHVINGTVLYSPMLPMTASENGPMSTKTTNATTAGGETLVFAYGNDGEVTVTLNNITARIVKSDVTVSNGVMHFIDSILFNTDSNVTAITSKNQAKSALAPIDAQTKAVATTSVPHTDGAAAFLTPSHVLAAVPFTLAMAALLTFV